MIRRIHGLALLLLAAGCSSVSADDLDTTEGRFSSDQETLLDFEFDGQLIADAAPAVDAKKPILDQLLYTVGHLASKNSVSRLGDVVLTNVQSAPPAAGKITIKYHAKFPVAWGSKTNLPTTYQFRIPNDVTVAGLKRFTAKYKAHCADPDQSDVAEASDWYFYRPQQAGCNIAAADVLTATATVTKSANNTTGKYPEYNRIWEDNELDVVVVFGKFDAHNPFNDPGLYAAKSFNDAIKKRLGNGATVQAAPFDPTITGATVDSGGVSPDYTVSQSLPGGRHVNVTSLLVNDIATAPAKFWQRYESLTPKADLIIYNGHAGLGANTRVFDSHGKWVAGKYAIMFMDGCSTFAYGDGLLASARATLNPDDPTGTKYMDVITDAMPGDFENGDANSSALVDVLLKYNAPMTYDQILATMRTTAKAAAAASYLSFENSFLLVSGEEDNTFTPGTAASSATPPAGPM